MITRTMDATFLNTVANHPDVRPYIGEGDTPLDLGPILANPANYALVTDGGGWLLQPIIGGSYELHTLFLAEARGKSYFRAAKEALRWMFTRTDALEVLTKCPDDNPGARMAATLMGFRERFHRDDAWAPGVGISYQVFTLDDWISRDAVIAKEGQAFHEAMEAAKAAAGSTLPVHPDDEAHDRVVGACVLMVKAGMTQKAVGVFNRWSVFAGYMPIQALSPTTIATGDAIVQVDGGEMKVLRWLESGDASGRTTPESASAEK